MGVLYIIVGLIAVAVVVFVLIGVGMLTKYLLRKYDSVYDDHDEVPSFLLGALVIIMLSLAIGLIVSLAYLIGQSIINALNK